MNTLLIETIDSISCKTRTKEAKATFKWAILVQVILRPNHLFHILKRILISTIRSANSVYKMWRSVVTPNVTLHSSYLFDVTSNQQDTCPDFDVKCKIKEQSLPVESNPITNLDLHFEKNNIHLRYKCNCRSQNIMPVAFWFIILCRY